MSNRTETDLLSSPNIKLSVIFLLYMVFAVTFGVAYKFQMNPDGLSLLRLSGYIAEGNFQQSVVSGWSPLMVWLVSPFLYFGLDGLTAARIAIGFCGAGLLLSTWFLSSRFAMSHNSRFIALLIAALLISFWTVQFIASDVLVAALTITYIYLVTDPEVLNKRRAAFLCGVAGGFSYLAHHYAFPFFVVHYPAMLLLRGYINREKEGLPWKKLAVSWTVGIAVFAIISSVWIGIVSAKYGILTISSKGGIAHAIMGPKDVDRRHPFFVGGLFKPREAHAMHVFEDPSDVKFKTWSPFESKEYFIHQLKVIKDNVVYIVDHFFTKSPFFNRSLTIGFCALIPVALLFRKMNRRKRFLYSWVVMTFCIYCSGFLLLIARSPRRFYALMIIFLLVLFHFFEELKNVIENNLPSGIRKVLLLFLLVGFVAAFVIKPGGHLVKALKTVIAAEQVNPYAEIAGQIKDVPFDSPYVIIRSSQKPHTDTYIAYYLGKQLLGRPLSENIDDLTKELRTADAKTLLVFDNPEIMESLKNSSDYVHIAHRQLKQDRRYLNAVNIEQDNIKGWDSEIDIFQLR